MTKLLFFLWWYWPAAVCILFAGALGVTLKPGGTRTLVVSVFLVLSLFARPLFSLADSFLRGYAVRRAEWIGHLCKQALEVPVHFAAEQPVVVDGFLDDNDYASMLNAEIDRAALRARQESAFPSVTIGPDQEPASRLYGVPGFGGTFPVEAVGHMRFRMGYSEMARRTLLERRFSYVEFPSSEPERGWKRKYSRYYLAPVGDPKCTGQPAATATSYCLAQETTGRSISRHRLVVDKAFRTSWTILYPRHIPVPAVAVYRVNRISVIDVTSGEALARFEGFDYPSRERPVYKCSNHAAVAAFLGASLRPHPGHPFLASQAWYPGSNIASFYADPARTEPDALPVEVSQEQVTLVVSGVPVAVAGRRCRHSDTAGRRAEQLVTAVRRLSGCNAIPEASVACLEDRAATATGPAVWRETWTFRMCGRSQAYVVEPIRNAAGKRDSLTPAKPSRGY